MQLALAFKIMQICSESILGCHHLYFQSGVELWWHGSRPRWALFCILLLCLSLSLSPSLSLSLPPLPVFLRWWWMLQGKEGKAVSLFLVLSFLGQRCPKKRKYFIDLGSSLKTSEIGHIFSFSLCAFFSQFVSCLYSSSSCSYLSNLTFIHDTDFQHFSCLTYVTLNLTDLSKSFHTNFHTQWQRMIITSNRLLCSARDCPHCTSQYVSSQLQAY